MLSGRRCYFLLSRHLGASLPATVCPTSSDAAGPAPRLQRCFARYRRDRDKAKDSEPPQGDNLPQSPAGEDADVSRPEVDLDYRCVLPEDSVVHLLHLVHRLTLRLGPVHPAGRPQSSCGPPAATSRNVKTPECWTICITFRSIGQSTRANHTRMCWRSCGARARCAGNHHDACGRGGLSRAQPALRLHHGRGTCTQPVLPLPACQLRPAACSACVHGFANGAERRSIVQIRMSPDNLTAYILWDAFPDQAEAAEKEIRAR